MSLASSLFISRELQAESLFLTQLPKKVRVEHYSLLEFAPVKFTLVPETDIIFFYSRNGVRYFFEQNPKIDTSQVTWACVGAGTAEELNKWNHKAAFVGRGTPKEVAEQYLSFVDGRSTLFPQAQDSRRSVQQLLGEQIQAEGLVVYQSSPKATFPKPNTDILIFTSPMNATAYFKTYPYENEILISIGVVTTAALQSLGFSDIHESNISKEESLFDLALRFV